MSISTNLALQLILLRVLPVKHALRPQRQPHIDPMFQLIPLHHLSMPTILQHKYNGRRLIKALSVASVGCCLLLALTWPLLIPSYHPTRTSLRLAT